MVPLRDVNGVLEQEAIKLSNSNLCFVRHKRLPSAAVCIRMRTFSSLSLHHTTRDLWASVICLEHCLKIKNKKKSAAKIGLKQVAAVGLSGTGSMCTLWNICCLAAGPGARFTRGDPVSLAEYQLLRALGGGHYIYWERNTGVDRRLGFSISHSSTCSLSAAMWSQSRLLKSE